MENGRSIFDGFNNFLDGLNTSINGGFETVNNVLGNLSAYEYAKSRNEAKNVVDRIDTRYESEQWNDYKAVDWSNPNVGSFGINNQLLLAGIVGLGIFAIVKIVK